MTLWLFVPWPVTVTGGNVCDSNGIWGCWFQCSLDIGAWLKCYGKAHDHRVHCRSHAGSELTGARHTLCAAAAAKSGLDLSFRAPKGAVATHVKAVYRHMAYGHVQLRNALRIKTCETGNENM